MVADLETIVAQLEASNYSFGHVAMASECTPLATLLASSSGPNCNIPKYAAIGAALGAIGFGLSSIAALASPDPISKFAVAGLLTTAAGLTVGTMAAISAYNECKQGQTANNQQPAVLDAARRVAMTAPISASVTLRGRRWKPA
jgi:sulfite exporter TauE/SafE